MSKEKQIEEMAKWLCADCSKDVPCSLVPIGAMCKTVWKRSEALYNAGYRKQSEGTWEKSDIPGEKYVCSECGGACWYYDYQGDVAKSKFCPNCGAKMKGV